MDVIAGDFLASLSLSLSLSLSGLKRITLMKDPVKGIGCTIKSAAGHILVNRIIEEGPIAHTGVLRPGKQHTPHPLHKSTQDKKNIIIIFVSRLVCMSD